MAAPKNVSPISKISGCNTLNPLQAEAAIVWLDPEARLQPYVRESLVYCGTRAARPPLPSEGERLVAFSTLEPNAPRFDESGFLRRAFTLRPQDTDGSHLRKMAPNGAVNPQTLAPGRKGDFVKLTAPDSTANNPNS